MSNFKSNDGDTIASRVVETLKKKKLTIATMESCTAGLLSSLITDTEGASQIFFGGYVTYANSAKENAGVDSPIIEKYGVYSKECAQAMALAAQRAFHTDIAIGITGTTGTVDPCNKDSVLGEVFYCIVLHDTCNSFHLQLSVNGMSRHEIKQAYADSVFTELLKLVTDCPSK
jgi:nicotinamide-nucleotide amidase